MGTHNKCKNDQHDQYYCKSKRYNTKLYNDEAPLQRMVQDFSIRYPPRGYQSNHLTACYIQALHLIQLVALDHLPTLNLPLLRHQYSEKSTLIDIKW